MKDQYHAYLKRREEIKRHPFGNIWLEQTSRYLHPFQIFGNVWYVGDSWVCVHLIDTGDGLLLIDSGNCGATAMLVQAIWEAGFDPADVRWIIHSHGHVDHIGGANFFKQMYGTKLLLSAPDAEMFREHPELSMIWDSHSDLDQLFVPDQKIRDGDILMFGNTTIRFVMVPGHTAGCLAMFFAATDGERTVRCGYYGGFGFNTLTDDYLTEIGDTSFQMRKTYLHSLEKVWDEPVELFLGNHCVDNDLFAHRLQQIKGTSEGNPYLDSTAWKKYLQKKHHELQNLYPELSNDAAI